MALSSVNKNAARFGLGGIAHSGVRVSKRRVGGCGRRRAKHVVCCPVSIEAAGFGRVVDIELDKHAVDEVSDFDDGFIAELSQRDGVGFVILVVHFHDDSVPAQRRVAARRVVGV